MGREIRRVPVGFDHPLNPIWPGFLNPHEPRKCPDCELGYSREARRFQDEWYGRERFRDVCPTCGGSGDDPKDAETIRLSEEWEPTDPPSGEAYQLWETVTEGSPITPAFADPAELARWCEGHQFDDQNLTRLNRGCRPWNRLAGGEEELTQDQWLKFIAGKGRAMSSVHSPEKGFQSGVSFVVGDQS